MKTIVRNSCVICKNEIKEVYTFKDFPIYMGVSKKPIDDDVNENMSFHECTKCGCVQLGNLIPLDILYYNPHNAAVGKMWDRHHYEFYQFIKKYVSGHVVEIGGGNLKIAKHLETQTNIKTITVYDSNSYGNYESDKITLKQELFNSKEIKDNVDVVIHSHLLEHLYNPIEELCEMSSLLSDGSYMAIAVPLIDKMLKDKFTNAMNFEHTYMTTFNMLEYMLNVADLEIIDNMNFSPYVTFIIAKKNTNIGKLESPYYRDSIDIFNNFIHYYNESVTEIMDSIAPNKENTFIFGAHIFTQYLFGFGLDMGLFKNVLDNDSNKIGDRLYGTPLYVSSPKILKNIENPVVVLKAAQYTEEIKNDILENINPNTKFIL